MDSWNYQESNWIFRTIVQRLQTDESSANISFFAGNLKIVLKIPRDRQQSRHSKRPVKDWSALNPSKGLLIIER